MVIRILPFALALPALAALTLAALTLQPQRAEASQCIALTHQQGQEMLVNSCGSCRIVNVDRLRPGMDKATSHTYTLPTGVPLPLSFRGPGTTRIMSEKPCDNAAPQGNANADDGKNCVSFQHNPEAGTVMLNGCRVCRLVVVERVDASGGQKYNRYSLVANSYVPLRADGAASARIVSDGPCPG
jgi:hypothetical protein